MSKLLDEAFSKISELSEPDQDCIAAWLLEELRSVRDWESLFSESPDTLSRLADEAVDEKGHNLTKELDPDKL